MTCFVTFVTAFVLLFTYGGSKKPSDATTCIADKSYKAPRDLRWVPLGAFLSSPTALQGGELCEDPF